MAWCDSKWSCEIYVRFNVEYYICSAIARRITANSLIFLSTKVAKFHEDTSINVYRMKTMKVSIFYPGWVAMILFTSSDKDYITDLHHTLPWLIKKSSTIV